MKILQTTSYNLPAGKAGLQAQQGFTLMEIVVSTTIFAVVLTMTLAIFNYALKINRRTEALRQTTQGMRNFTEFLVKEIRNGKIEYSATPVSASCESNYVSASNYTTYLALVSETGDRECIYLTGTDLFIAKEELDPQLLNPVNFSVDMLRFFVQPTTDPYDVASPPDIQPMVTLIMRVTVTLPTGEVRTIPYQTSISTDAYDLP